MIYMCIKTCMIYIILSIKFLPIPSNILSHDTEVFGFTFEEHIPDISQGIMYKNNTTVTVQSNIEAKKKKRLIRGISFLFHKSIFVCESRIIMGILSLLKPKRL